MFDPFIPGEERPGVKRVDIFPLLLSWWSVPVALLIYLHVDVFPEIITDRILSKTHSRVIGMTTERPLSRERRSQGHECGVVPEQHCRPPVTETSIRRTQGRHIGT